MEHRLASQRTDAGLVERLLITAHAGGLALPRGDLRPAATLDPIRAVDERYGLQQPLPFFVRHPREHTAVGRDRFEQLDRLAQPLERRHDAWWGPLRHAYAPNCFSMKISSM
jgi:hypothetical protein